ncbi:MAG: tetratricopeptide repeat protein, partial [Candidatus Tectomicrobia bacterium]|nr:tetratricopeptide repeat protein [Candidatus Tectomicrobia bacterium]
TRNISDAELDDALRALLNAPQHAVKVILTTRIAPFDLALVQPGRQTRQDLDEGLDSPYAENILREMDVDGKVGLKTAPEEVLDEARQRTRGYPRALEALFAILSADRDTSLHEILAATETLLPENVVEVLVGEAFSRLDTAAQMVMQALAAYARPVTPTAVDYLLQPHLSGVNSASVLGRLVNMQFARREAGRYYLHPVDRAYALSRIPMGEESDRDEEDAPPFTQFALLHHGANYFQQARTPRENWKTIDDLTPQLAEFDLRCAGQEYDVAAEVLLEIDFDYLLLWGHSRLVAELHVRLQRRLSNPQLNQHSVGNLGSAYLSIGKIQEAIICCEQALDGAREMKDREGEVAWLGNLGNCYSDLGQIARAIDFYEQALAIAREIGDRGGERSALGSLGSRYADLGQTTRAIDFYEQALAIAREIGDRRGKGTQLGNLGNCYGDLGQIAHAIDFYEQALAIAREIGDRYVESGILSNLSEIQVDQGVWDQAIELSHQAMQIADEIENLQFRMATRLGLALAHLYAGDLPAAHDVAEAAGQFDVPEGNHQVRVLLGVIALRQDDRIAAAEAFAAALGQAESILAQSTQNYAALDTKGLALCGLTLCDHNHIATAIEAYQEARAINRDPGIVARVLRLFDALALADSAGRLAEARRAAAGE